MNLKIKIDGKKINTVSETKICTFKEWGLTEESIENFVCDNLQLIFGEDTSYLLVGRQVKDKENKRNDLLAIDDEGALVLIEIKRDLDDMAHRYEALEFQAIRYCSSLATIKTPEDLVNTSYSKYIEKYDRLYTGDLTAHERARKNLREFLFQNKCADDFNKKQRIILISSDYDKTTLSACAWLIQNGVDITLIKLSPMENNGDKEVDISVVLPSKKESDYFVDLLSNYESFETKQSRITRTNLPKMDWLIKEKLVHIGDKIYVIGHEDKKAVIKDAKNVEFEGIIMTFNAFGCKITGWTSIQTYAWMKIEGNDKTLSELREEKMKELKMI